MSLLGGALRGLLSLPTPLLRRLTGPPRFSAEGHQLDLQTQMLLKLMALEPELRRQGVARARRVMDFQAPMVDLPRREIETSDVMAPLPMRLYRPQAPKGTLVYFHGGGWVIGSIRSHDRLCRALADDAGVLVVSVGYRLAPEHRYPAAIEDALLATRWALDRYGAPLGVAGDSAGGSLAATVALQLRERLRLQLLVYPSTDLARSQPSHEQFRDGFLLTKASMDWFLDHYVAPEQYREPLGSPFYAADLAGAPRAMVMTAGFDPLRDEGRAYAGRLLKAGVTVDDRLYPSLIHGFYSMAGIISAARAAYDDSVGFLRAGFSEDVPARA